MKKFNAFYSDKMKLYSDVEGSAQLNEYQMPSTPTQPQTTTTQTTPTTPVTPAKAPTATTQPKPPTPPATNQPDISDLVKKLLALKPGDLQKLQTDYAAALKTSTTQPAQATTQPPK